MFLAFQSFVLQLTVVHVVVVTPNYEYLAYILLASDRMMAQEGKRLVFGKVPGDHWFHNQIQNDKLFDMLHESLVFSQNLFSKIKNLIVSFILVLISELPLDADKFGHFGWAEQHCSTC